MSKLATNGWHIFYVKAKWEKKVCTHLAKKNIEFFCPMQKVERSAYNRKFTVEEPVLASHIFVKISADQLTTIKAITGVLNVIHWLDKPASIKDDDIQSLRTFLSNNTIAKLQRTKLNFEAGTKLTNILRDHRSSNPGEGLTYTSIFEFPAIGYTFIGQDTQVAAAASALYESPATEVENTKPINQLSPLNA